MQSWGDCTAGLMHRDATCSLRASLCPNVYTYCLYRIIHPKLDARVLYLLDDSTRSSSLPAGPTCLMGVNLSSILWRNRSSRVLKYRFDVFCFLFTFHIHIHPHPSQIHFSGRHFKMKLLSKSWLEKVLTILINKYNTNITFYGRSHCCYHSCYHKY